MKKTILTIGITILSCLLSFTNLQAELGWKHISKLAKSGKMNMILDAKSFNGKCYVLCVDNNKHKYKVSEDKGESWGNLLSHNEMAVKNRDYVGQIIDEKNVIFYINDSFMKTVNGGANWHKVPLKGKINDVAVEVSKVRLYNIQMCNPQIGISYGRYGDEYAVYTTEDGWENMEGKIVKYTEEVEGISDTVIYNYYKRIGKDTIIRSGYYKTAEDNNKIVISYSYDKGKTYTRHDTLNQEFQTLKPMIQIFPIRKNSAGFWTLSGGKFKPETERNGRVYKCKNLGDKWEEIFFKENHNPVVVNDFYNENRGVVMNLWDNITASRTYDGGKTWQMDTLITSEGKIESGKEPNYVVYVGDTALIMCGDYTGNVYRLGDVKMKEYDVDTLEQVKIIAKEDKFEKSKLTIIAYVNIEDRDECWIDLNNNKKREANEKINVLMPKEYPKEDSFILNNKEVIIYGKFINLWLYESGIGEVQLNKCPSLEGIYVKDNPINAIDIKSCPNIEALGIEDDKSLNNLDLRENSKLKTLSIVKTPVKELYLPKDNNLVDFNLEDTKMKEVDLTSFKDTATVMLMYNSKLKNVKIDDNSKIKSFIMNECQDEVSTMNLSGLKNATYIDVENTSFTELDLSQCKKVRTIEVMNNVELKKIKLPQHDSLMSVDVSRNYISELDFKPSKNTQVFYCHDNADISKLDFTGNEGLAVVDCFRNQIKGDEADKLMESLPDRTGKKPEGRIRFTAYNSDGKYKVGNWAYAYSVEKAKAKNWSIQYYPQGDYKGTSSVSEGTMKVFNIYPNPADNILNIPEHETLITDIEIYNSSLDQVKILSPAAKIDISELPAGVYYIKLNYVMHKFVKK